MSTLTAIDLFCGCGGLSCGFSQEGFGVRLGADMRQTALDAFKKNFPDALTLNADLSELEPTALLDALGMMEGELDCLYGGPPCQGFSKNVVASRRSLEDPRNRLILRFLEFVSSLRPKFVLIENVAEMKNAYGEAYTSQIIEIFEELGYEATSFRLNAADFGVPQLRRRAFFLANRLGIHMDRPQPSHLASSKSPDLFNCLTAENHVTAWEAISDLPSLGSGEGTSPCAYGAEPQNDYQREMRRGSQQVEDHVARDLKSRQLERVMHLEPGMGQGVETLPDHLKPKSGYSGAYARLRPDEPARTITRWVFHPGSGRFYHPYDYRVITIREAARLQSFPDRYHFSGSYNDKASQIGESVPPLMARAIAMEVRAALERHRQAEPTPAS